MKSVVLTIAMLVGTSAYADDAQPYNWSGAYVGVSAGYAWSNSKTEYSFFETTNPSDINRGYYNLSGDAVSGGAQAGYNWQILQTIVGLEGDMQTARINARRNFHPVTDDKTQIKWFGSVRARVGYLPNDRWMIFATGGLAYGKVSSSAYNIGQSSKIKFGYSAGAGTEYALNGNWSIKSEYLFTSLGHVKIKANTGMFNYKQSAGSDFHIVRAGVNYKF